MSKTLPRYELIEVDGEDSWCVKLKSGEYANVVYKYVHVKALAPDTDDGYATLKFNYEVLYHAELPEEKFAKNAAFENSLGDILYELIMSHEDKKEDE
jgi:hypothetical protein